MINVDPPLHVVAAPILAPILQALALLITNLTFNPNQIQELVLEKVKYLILCVATDIQEPNSLQMSSLLPNLRRCVQVSVRHNIYYDANSMMFHYQCLPQNVIVATQLIACSHPAHHCLVFNSHEKNSSS